MKLLRIFAICCCCATLLLLLTGQSAAAGDVDTVAPDPQLVAAHQYAITLLKNAVPKDATGEAHLMRMGDSLWVCAVTVKHKNGLVKDEAVSDTASPERACTQAVLKLVRTKGL